MRGLLRWYRTSGRDLPWRQAADPYAVWVSEVMLQQTQVARVVPAYTEFLARFPSVGALAAAPLGAVLEQWGSLGYPRRARDLWRAAGIVVTDMGGGVPSEPAVLRSLPGIGDYTANAIAAFGFGDPTVRPVDTNVLRVARRYHFVPLASPSRRGIAASLAGIDGAPDVFHALMDVGATLCRAASTVCDACPLASRCACAHVVPAPPISVRRQAAFAGSRRQARGAVLRRLREGPVSWRELDASVVDELAAEGLVERRGELVGLPG